MKKTILTFCMAVAAMFSLNATVESFHGTTFVSAYGNTESSQEGGVSITTGDNGLDGLQFIVNPFAINNIEFDNVPRTTSGGITVYSAERDVKIGLQEPTRAILLARVADSLMTAEVYLPEIDVYISFNNVGNHFQLPNSDLEAWTASNGEPDRWHGFKTAKGALAAMAANGGKLMSSDDVRPGSAGEHSAMITTGRVWGVLANGTMTNGQLNAGGISADDTKNHAEMDKDASTTDALDNKFYMPVYAKPDAFKAWIKYVQGKTNPDFKANVSVKTFDGTYYQEPTDKEYTNLSGSIIGGQIEACDWTEFSFPFDYDSYAANGAATQAIFVTFSTNATPGEGNDNDAVYIDDMELVYLGNMTDLRYQGQTISGWNPAVTTYSMEMAGEPNLDDFTATIEGASAVLTKSMEQNADGSYRIAISVVAGDLQQATCYVINVTAPQGLKGDVNNDSHVNISDVTALIDYILSSDSEINQSNADTNSDGSINISDVTNLIDMILGGVN